ncbi:RcnB family protein [Diaphorobacter sp.]|uniref:RcnB family protein n=1 Tax=Diaphorobacter sp. TaxID=1934310 RepID=UPI0028AFB3D4|nr:RcnB family protein [Diaphorobacter sp.]
MKATNGSTTKRCMAAALAVVLGVTSVGAFAQPGPRHDDRRGPPPKHYDQRHDHRPNVRPPNHRPGPPPQAYHRGAGPDHRWHRGDRIPQAYRTRSYVVDDWRYHRLSAPPRGYQWVQYGGDYLLIAIATGVIASMVLGN